MEGNGRHGGGVRPREDGGPGRVVPYPHLAHAEMGWGSGGGGGGVKALGMARKGRGPKGEGETEEGEAGGLGVPAHPGGGGNGSSLPRWAWGVEGGGLSIPSTSWPPVFVLHFGGNDTPPSGGGGGTVWSRPQVTAKGRWRAVSRPVIPTRGKAQLSGSQDAAVSCKREGRWRARGRGDWPGPCLVPPPPSLRRVPLASGGRLASNPTEGNGVHPRSVSEIWE